MQKVIALAGKWNVFTPDFEANVQIPGTLDTNGVGICNEKKEEGRLTRKFEYSGKAVYEREVFIPQEWEGHSVFLFIERTRFARVFVNGRPGVADEDNTLSTQNMFDVTQTVETGRVNTVRVEVDNTYPQMPAKSILYSSAATDETQTNWNGMLGRVELQAQPPLYVKRVCVYPITNDTVKVKVVINNKTLNVVRGEAEISSPVFGAALSLRYCIAANTECETEAMAKCTPSTRKWSEYQPCLYPVTVRTGESEKTVMFGLRRFGVSRDYKFTVNERRIFLRSEANCCVFPLTGHPPMTAEEWKAIFDRYRQYGVNCVRFHSWCPPEAAFVAADETGMLLQCELSNWNPSDNFEAEFSEEYYRKEAFAIVRSYANHPSFFMLTFGNELQAGKEGHAKMDTLLAELKTYDPTRLYSDASNPHYGALGPNPKADFFTAQQWGEYPFRGIFANCEGHINNSYPSLKTDYSQGVQRVHESAGIPVFSFEVGQFQVCPDYGEIEKYTGCLLPANLQIPQKKLQEKGRFDRYPRYTQVSGELAYICYKEEAEAALRTKDLAGISILGLQDFPGQGMALVGMTNAFLQQKPYPFARPERFRRFFNDVILLAVTEKYTYTDREELTLYLKAANYSEDTIKEQLLHYEVKAGDMVLYSGRKVVSAPQGELTEVGEVRISLQAISHPCKLTFSLWLGNYENEYEFWVYPERTEVQPKTVYCCEYLDERAKEILRAGGKVFLQPKANVKALPFSIGGEFSTDFWCIATFKDQQGSMGLNIDNTHPALALFPSQIHSNWQWWAMARLGRPMILDGLSADVKPIVEVVDTFSRQNYMGLLFECRIGKGSLMVSSMDLESNLQYPEVRALKKSILDYMDTGKFCPKVQLNEEEIEKLILREE